MNNSEPLVWYGICVMIICGCFIAIPYWRGKTDLLTGWNVLLLGMGMWTGFGCLEVRYGNWPWAELQWFQPTRQEVKWYMLNSGAFLAALLTFYYYNPLGKRIAARRLQKWPPDTGSTYILVLAICAAIAFASFVVPRTNFVGLVVAQLSHKAAVFACVFSFILWYRDRINVAWLMAFIGAFVMAALFAMIVSGGRRLLLSVFLGPILCFYWIHARHWKPRNTLAALSVAACAILVVSVVYSSFRWYSRGPSQQQRTVGAIVEQLRGLQHREGLFQIIFANKLNYFSQNNVHYAMLAKRYVDTGQLIPKPLNTLRFVLSYPIPRRVWEGKPKVLGIVVPHELAHIYSTNWGLGPAGHAAYEGGIPAMILYALLAAMGIRLMDDPLRLQPNNPFLISLHAAALPHVAGFARGDFGIMTIETAECFLFAIMLSVACRMLFGTQPSNVRGRVKVSHATYGYLRQGQRLGPPGVHR
ncbi:MAG: hypothetical protein WD669_10075 [Pirellulales bacterium]